MISVSNAVFPILFADDTNILFTNKDLSRLKDTVNREMISISQWFNVNKLSINVAKTKYIVFHQKGRSVDCENLHISINDNRIENVCSMKFLGVIIDQNLSWKNHVDHICKKIGKALGVLHRIRHQVPGYIMLQLYNTLIMSHINYAISAYGCTDKCNLKRILILQKKAIRCITNSPYNSHCNPLFVKCKLLNVHDMYAMSCLKLAYLFKCNGLPAYHMSTLMHPNQITLTTRQTHDFFIPMVKMKVSKQCLKYKVGSIWNSLPLVMKKYGKSVYAFLRKLKAHFLTQYDVVCNIPNCYSCQFSFTDSRVYL